MSRTTAAAGLPLAALAEPAPRVAAGADHWRFLFALAAMFLATSAFYNFSLQPHPPADAGVVVDNTRGDLLNMAGWLALYAVSAAVALRSLWTQGFEARLAALLPFVFYVLASSLWSGAPTESLVFCIMLAADVVVADALATQVPPATLLSALARLVTVCVAISLVLLVVFPDAVTSTPDRPGLLTEGEFSGVFGHKVQMGMNAAAAIVVLLFWRDAMPSRLWRGVAIAVCLLGVLLANSASAIVALAVSVATITLGRALPRLRGMLFRVVGLVALGVAVALPYFDIGALTGLVGRSSTLTGRTDFWQLAPGYILERPWFGFGYGGFFELGPYSRVWDLWSRFEYFFTPNFHNSALDVTILLGVVGLAAYVAIVAAALAVHANRSLGRSADVLAGLVVMFTVSSATDFQFMRHNCLATVLLFYAVLVAGRTYAPRFAGPGPLRVAS